MQNTINWLQLLIWRICAYKTIQSVFVPNLKLFGSKKQLQPAQVGEFSNMTWVIWDNGHNFNITPTGAIFQVVQ